METQVPLISSSVAGPLGVIHLPRLWQKCILSAVNKLQDGYGPIEGGFDTMVLNTLNLKIPSVTEYIATQKPTYPEF